MWTWTVDIDVDIMDMNMDRDVETVTHMDTYIDTDTDTDMVIEWTPSMDMIIDTIIIPPRVNGFLTQITKGKCYEVTVPLRNK